MCLMCAYYCYMRYTLYACYAGRYNPGLCRRSPLREGRAWNEAVQNPHLSGDRDVHCPTLCGGEKDAFLI